MLCVSRVNQARDDVLLVVVNLDPTIPRRHHLARPGGARPPRGHPFEAHDELTGTTYIWQGPESYVRLDPAQQSAHVLHLRRR